MAGFLPCRFSVLDGLFVVSFLSAGFLSYYFFSCWLPFWKVSFLVVFIPCLSSSLLVLFLAVSVRRSFLSH